MNKYGSDRSNAISRSLDIISKMIAMGSKPGNWPGDCPLHEECPHVTHPSGRPGRWSRFLAVFALILISGISGFSAKRLVAISPTPNTAEECEIATIVAHRDAAVATGVSHALHSELLVTALSPHTLVTGIFGWIIDGSETWFIQEVSPTGDGLTRTTRVFANSPPSTIELQFMSSEADSLRELAPAIGLYVGRKKFTVDGNEIDARLWEINSSTVQSAVLAEWINR